MPGAISGVVSSSDAAPLGGASVILFRVDGSPAGASTATGAAGLFRLTVSPGQYKLFFSHPSGDYQSAWYGGYTPGSAAVVTVVSGQEVAIAQALSRTTAGGSLAGTARDQSGAGVAGVNVFAFLFINNTCLTGPCDALELKGNAVTDSKGAY
ncbi:MAG: carboxypeptidase-like regulatory domain-containing protein, partial [Thermoleophilia bacterium]